MIKKYSGSTRSNSAAHSAKSLGEIVNADLVGKHGMIPNVMANKPDPNELLTLKEAAARFNVKRRTLAAAVTREGSGLEGRRMGGYLWVVRAGDVVNWIHFGNHDGGPILHYKIKARQEQEAAKEQAS